MNYDTETANGTADDDRPPASAEESLRLIREQRAEAERSLTPDPRLLYGSWGLAWLVGFGLLFLRDGPDGRVFVSMPRWLPLATLFGLMIIAAVVSAVVGTRAYRHVTGESSTKGRRYGLAWFMGFFGVGVIAGRLSDRLPEDEVGLLWASMSVAVVAVLYLAGSAVWSDRPMFVLGSWIGIVNIVGVIAGAGWHSLAIAVAGGGGLLMAGLYERFRMGRPA